MKEMSTLGFSTKSSEEIGEKEEMIKERISGALKNRFKPEFLNRVDEVIIFHSLTPADLEKIVEIQLARVGERLKQKNISMEVSKAVKEVLTKKGYDFKYGARPLKRVIQQMILDELAKRIVEGKLKSNSSVLIDAQNGTILVKSK